LDTNRWLMFFFVFLFTDMVRFSNIEEISFYDLSKQKLKDTSWQVESRFDLDIHG